MAEGSQDYESDIKQSLRNYSAKKSPAAEKGTLNSTLKSTESTARATTDIITPTQISMMDPKKKETQVPEETTNV